jgi:hypothetical protein
MSKEFSDFCTLVANISMKKESLSSYTALMNSLDPSLRN